MSTQKKSFREMTIGQRFIQSDGGDGEYDQHYYKISDTEAVNVSRGNLREEVVPSEVFDVTGETIVVHANPTEVERVAVTLLHNCWVSGIEHIGLRDYVEALCKNPNERRSINTFIWENVELRDAMNERGFSTPTTMWERDDKHSAWRQLIDRQTNGYPEIGDTMKRHEAAVNDIIVRLTFALECYREAGRPDGNQTSSINGLGGPLVAVETSLAAAIVEFHQRIINEMYVWLKNEDI